MFERGWAARDGQTGQIELGPRVAWLAHTAPVSPLAAGFHGVARRLVARHNETTCLTVLDGRDSVFIAKEETTHQVRLVTSVGSRLPAFASASGRVLLADRPEDEVAALYDGCELVTPTGRRLAGLEELFAILREAGAAATPKTSTRPRSASNAWPYPLAPRKGGRRDHPVRADRADERRPRREMLPDLLGAAREIVAAPANGNRAPRSRATAMTPWPSNTSPNQSSKLELMATSARGSRGRRRVDSNRKVAP